MTTRITLISLGCEKNMINSEQMLWLLKNEGYTITSELSETDVAILNTCGFIESAKNEAIYNIIELGKLKKQGKLKKIIVCGCLPERYRNEIMKEMPEIDGLVGCGGFSDICSAVSKVMKNRKPRTFGDINAEIHETPRMVTTPGHYAYLKIAEGCDNNCAYCVIPSLRGRYRSRTVEKITEEARLLAKSGVKELILIAQDTSRYGLDLYGERRLPELLRELCKIDGLLWLRLHYLYPDGIDEKLITVVAEEEKIVKYLDIPIQHVNTDILKRMNRRGGKEELDTLLRTLRAKIPGLALRTSIICGLPGETENEFTELCSFLKEHKIERVGVFPYSPEEGTPAALMSDRAEPEKAADRADTVLSIQAGIMDEYNESRIGQTLCVLCDGYDDSSDCNVGRSYADSPEIDGRVYFISQNPVEEGQMVHVKITGTQDGEPYGEMCEL